MIAPRRIELRANIEIRDLRGWPKYVVYCNSVAVYSTHDYVRARAWMRLKYGLTDKQLCTIEDDFISS
jgi:hypothetical protein